MTIKMDDRLIIFDLDGTLYRTDYVLKQAVKLAARELDIPVPSDNHILDSIGGTPSGFGHNIGAGLDTVKKEKFLEHIRFHDRRLIPEMGKCYRGVKELLSVLVEQGFKLAVCSNGSEAYVSLVLKSCGIEKYFSVIKGRREGVSKSEQVSLILKETQSKRAILVGDRKFDLHAAGENNIPFIGAAYGYGEKEIRQADFIAKSPDHLRSVIIKCAFFERIDSDLEGIEKNGAVIAGIDGIDTSGKTVFAESLTRYLQCRNRQVQLIHLDDFLNESRVRKTGENPAQAYISNAFNLDLLESRLIDPSNRGETVRTELRLLNLETDRFDREVSFHIDPNTIVIIEGVLLYREPLDRYFDYRVYLDISFNEMLKRASARDRSRFGDQLRERYKQKYIPIQEWYIKECNPREKSDLIIDNTHYEIPVVLNPE